MLAVLKVYEIGEQESGPDTFLAYSLIYTLVSAGRDKYLEPAGESEKDPSRMRILMAYLQEYGLLCDGEVPSDLPRRPLLRLCLVLLALPDVCSGFVACLAHEWKIPASGSGDLTEVLRCLSRPLNEWGGSTSPLFTYAGFAPNLTGGGFKKGRIGWLLDAVRHTIGERIGFMPQPDKTLRLIQLDLAAVTIPCESVGQEENDLRSLYTALEGHTPGSLQSLCAGLIICINWLRVGIVSPLCHWTSCEPKEQATLVMYNTWMQVYNVICNYRKTQVDTTRCKVENNPEFVIIGSEARVVCVQQEPDGVGGHSVHLLNLLVHLYNGKSGLSLEVIEDMRYLLLNEVEIICTNLQSDDVKATEEKLNHTVSWILQHGQIRTLAAVPLLELLEKRR
jgi:hypothetical protein